MLHEMVEPEALPAWVPMSQVEELPSHLSLHFQSFLRHRKVCALHSIQWHESTGNISALSAEEWLAARFGKDYQLVQKRMVTSLCLS